jgi:serine/threonine-protein kinase PknK
LRRCAAIWGGLPLALELAAAHARVLSPAAILAHVQDPSELLSGGHSDAPERQQTLTATIDWSYRLLSDEERGLFAGLGVFVGGFAVEAVEAVCGEGDKVVDGIGALLDHGLIHRRSPGAEGPRLGMLERIRQYALRRLREDDHLDEAMRRHAIYYAEFAEAAAAGLQSSKQLVWLDALDCEQANLRAVLDRCEALGEIDLGVRVAGAHLRCWLIRDLADEIRQWLERALRLSTGDPRVRARAFLVHGVMAVHVAQLDEARRSYDACLELCQELGDVGLTALCEGEQAFLEACRGGSAQIAADQSRRALSHAQASGDPWVLVITLVLAAAAGSRYEEERAFAEEALELTTALGDRIQSPLVKSNLGSAAILAGDLVQLEPASSRLRRNRRRCGAPAAGPPLRATSGCSSCSMSATTRHSGSSRLHSVSRLGLGSAAQSVRR